MAKFKVNYCVWGQITVEANDEDEAYQNFFDKCGFSNDDLYENLDHKFIPSSIEEIASDENSK